MESVAMWEHGGSNRTGSASGFAVLHPEKQCNDSIVKHLVKQISSFNYGLQISKIKLNFWFRIFNSYRTHQWSDRDGERAPAPARSSDPLVAERRILQAAAAATALLVEAVRGKWEAGTCGAAGWVGFVVREGGPAPRSPAGAGAELKKKPGRRDGRVG